MIDSKETKRSLNMSDEENISLNKKQRLFCAKTFRKGLNSNDRLKNLQIFSDIAHNKTQDVALEYLEAGGSVYELVSLLDVTAKGDLTASLPVFRAVHYVIIKSEAEGVKYQKETEDGIKYLLDTFMTTILSMININSSKHRKVVLKLLTSIITFNPLFGREIVSLVKFTPTMIEEFVLPSTGKDSLRKSFIFFILSFLIEGNLISIQAVLEVKGLVSSIIPGLKFDEAHIVSLVLSMLKEKILENPNIQKTSKLNVFNTNVVLSLFDLFDWKGPRNIKANLEGKKLKHVKEVEVYPEERKLVVESLHSFLEVLCTSKKHGIIFVDKTVGTSSTNNNQLLTTVLENLGMFWEYEEVSKIIIKILASCPDLIKSVLFKMESSFQPRESLQWLKVISFAENLLTSLNASSLMEMMDLGIQKKINIIRSLAVPLPLVKNLSCGFEKSQPLTVQYHCIKLLILMWNKSQEYLTLFKSHEIQIKKAVIHSLLNFLPNFDYLLSLWQQICAGDSKKLSSFLPDEQNTSVLLIILNAMKMVIECSQDGIDSIGIIANEMMKNLENLKELTGDGFTNVQIKILQLVSIADPTFLTQESDLFKNALAVLFKINNEESLATLSKILLHSNLFENNEAEIDVWLDCFFSLPEENRQEVSKTLIKCICQAFCEQSEVDQIRPERELKVTEKENILLELMERDMGEDKKYSKITFETLTPMLKNCLEAVSLKKKKLFTYYICDVVKGLLHFYSDKNSVICVCENFPQHLPDSMKEYLEYWKGKDALNVDLTIFNDGLEAKLINWLLLDDAKEKVSELFQKEEINLMKRFLLLKMVTSYLVHFAESNLNTTKGNKFVECLSYLIDLKEFKDSDSCGLVLASDVGNLNLFHRKSLNSLFSDESLLQLFNIFEKNDSLKIFSNVLVNILMKENTDTIKKIMTCESVINQWKMKFLRQLKSKIRKKKNSDFSNLEDVLNFFEFDLNDSSEVLKELSLIEDLDFFIFNEELSKWSIVLMKFVNLHCACSYDNEEVMKMLCKIIKHTEKNPNIDLNLVDKCLADILEGNPVNLMFIENDFMESILFRSNVNIWTIRLGKLLLNDPDKVDHFLKFALDNSENLKGCKMILPMLSCLLYNDDKYLEILQTNEAISIWDERKVFSNKDDLLFKVLKSTFSNLESDILNAAVKKKPSYILNNVQIVSLLIKRFMNMKSLHTVRKKIIDGKSFHPRLCLEAILKLNQPKLVKLYLEGLLKELCEVLSNGKEDDWEDYCIVISTLSEKFKNQDWSSLANSPTWKDYTSLTLKIGFDASSSPSLLKLLRVFIEAIFQKESSSGSIKKLFQMVISHSEFLKVILTSSPIKTELVRLYLTLIERNTSIMALKHVPVILASYSASLSLSDQTLVKIFHCYENAGIEVAKYQPYFWGEAAVNHYSVRPASSASLMRQMNVANVLDILDLKKVKMTLTNFPQDRNIDLNKFTVDNPDVYDPAFFLPLFANLLSPGASINCQAFIYKGALALTIRSLSSKCEKIRMVASLILARFYNHLELVQNMKQKLTWLHFIDCIRYGTEDLLGKPPSNIAALFLARATLEICEPLGVMYTPLTNFVLAKPVFDLNSLPEFIVLFHSSDINFHKHREWILEILRDGIKQNKDVAIILEARSLKLILSFYQTHLCSKELELLILEILASAVKVYPMPLMSGYGLLSWMNLVCQSPDKSLLEPIITLASTVMDFIKKTFQQKDKKEQCKPLLFEFFNLIMKLIPRFDDSNHKSIFLKYLAILLDCLLIFYQEKMFHGVKLTRNKLNELIGIGNVVLGESTLNYTKTIFYFRKHEENDLEILRKVVFIYQKILNQ